MLTRKRLGYLFCGYLRLFVEQGGGGREVAELARAYV